MKLYTYPLSGHAHRARLFLSLVGAAHQTIDVDLRAREQKSPAFLAITPFGQVPVLDDDGTIVADSNAILVYVAKKLGRVDWLPEDPAGAARVQRWLSVAAGEIASGPAVARWRTLFHPELDASEAIALSHDILALIEATLAGDAWLAADRPTIADVALYSYVARAPEGDVDLAPYGHVVDWLARMEALPGFVPFESTVVGRAA